MAPLLLYIALVSIGQTPFDVSVPVESLRELSLMSNLSETLNMLTEKCQKTQNSSKLSLGLRVLHFINDLDLFTVRKPIVGTNNLAAKFDLTVPIYISLNSM